VRQTEDVHDGRRNFLPYGVQLQDHAGQVFRSSKMSSVCCSGAEIHGCDKIASLNATFALSRATNSHPPQPENPR